MIRLKEDFGISDDCMVRCSKLHVVSENRMVFQLNTTKATDDEFWCIKVDDCMVTNKDSRCDYAFLRNKKDDSDNDFYFVELKGSNIQKAFDQILITIQKHFKNPPKQNVYGFIVASKVPTGAGAQNLRKDFVKKHGVDLIIKSNFLKFIPE